MEPHTTEIMTEGERLFIQPTEKPSTTKSDDSSFPKTLLHRREGQVSSPWEGAVDGKENKHPKSVSKDDEYEDNQLSHQDDEYISSNETRLAMEPVKPESEYVFIQRTPKSSTTEFDNSKLSSSPKTLLHRREEQVSPLGWGAAGGKGKEPMRYPSNDDDSNDDDEEEHEGEQLSDQDDEYISSNETMMAKEPGTTKIMSESERLFIQPTQKPWTTELDYFELPSSNEASSSKTLLHRREGQVSPLGWGAAGGKGKGKEPMRYFSNDFDDKHKDEQLSHQYDEYISSNETKIEMEPETTEIESLLIHPTQSASTTGFQGSDDSDLQFFPKTLFHRRKGHVTPLVVNTKRAVEGKESMAPPQDEEDNSKQFRKDKKEQFSMDKKEQFKMDKKEQFRMDKKEQFGMDKNGQSSMDKNGQSSMDKNGQSSMDKNKQSSMDKDEQSRAFLDSDDELESDDEPSAQDGWVGDGDQMAALILTLRWARAYRVSIQVAGRMLKMGPEIVNRALWVEATDEPIVLRVRPVIRHWLKLGPLWGFFFAWWKGDELGEGEEQRNGGLEADEVWVVFYLWSIFGSVEEVGGGDGKAKSIMLPRFGLSLCYYGRRRRLQRFALRIIS